MHLEERGSIHDSTLAPIQWNDRIPTMNLYFHSDYKLLMYFLVFQVTIFHLSGMTIADVYVKWYIQHSYHDTVIMTYRT